MDDSYLLLITPGILLSLKMQKDHGDLNKLVLHLKHKKSVLRDPWEEIYLILITELECHQKLLAVIECLRVPDLGVLI